MGKYVPLTEKRVQLPVRVTLKTKATLDEMGADSYGLAVDVLASEWRDRQNGTVTERIAARHEGLKSIVVAAAEDKNGSQP